VAHTTGPVHGHNYKTMILRRVTVIHVLSACIFYCVSAFNLDTHVPLIKVGQPRSYFGYTVAIHFRATEPL
jgi:hypothetical protein